jgi:glycosyltransferase involved in cell wall biosynthesis
MHVAYIHQYFSTKQGSTGTRSYEMAQRLIAAGHRVTMICGVSDHSPEALQRTYHISELELDGIRVMCVAEPYSNKMGFARRVLAFGRFARQAARIIRGLDADLVFATSTPLTVGIPGMKGARHLGVPFVFEVRDLWPELPIAMGIVRNPLLKWYLRRMERRICFAAERIIALAPGIQAGIVQTGYPAEKVRMIPNACDLDLFRPSDEPLDDERFGAPDDFRLVFTGAHGLANGLDAVLDAAAELKRRGATGVRFIFIGSGGQRDRLMQRSRDDGLESLTTWISSIPKAELARVLPRMDVGMMILKNVPAFYYGTSPNKFFDYISSGLPVLNNYPGWLAGMIEEKQCGLAVPPDDPKAFADAVLWLRDHPDERRAMGRRARELAEERFSRDELGRQFVATLEEVHRGG